jgi:hypothetical protein
VGKGPRGVQEVPHGKRILTLTLLKHKILGFIFLI